MRSLLWIPIVCLAAAAFFSMAEMAFIAASRIRLRHLADEGHRVAARYLEAFAHPEPLLSTAMIGVTVSHVVAASALTWLLLPTLGLWAPLVTAIGLTPVMLVLGEVVPKAIARERATGLILRLFRPLVWSTRVLGPVAAVAHAVVRAALGLFGGGAPDVRRFVSREELKALLQLEPGEADVTTHEAEMIDKIFHLADTTVREVMVPLVDVAMLPTTATTDDAVAIMSERGFSRLPIYRQRERDIVGVVAAMDVLRRGIEVQAITELMRPPYYVPETKQIDDLLRDMQRARTHMAIVVDEFGAATGIVTLEDILEEIVGQIEDEHDRPPASIERLPDGSYWVAARTHIDELNETLDWTLPKEDYETVAGLVLAILHRIPRTGEEFQVPGYTITVLEADSRRILAVKITPTRPAPAPGPPASTPPTL